MPEFPQTAQVLSFFLILHCQYSYACPPLSLLADSDIRYREYNHEGIFVGVYSYLDETGEFKPVKIFME